MDEYRDRKAKRDHHLAELGKRESTLVASQRAAAESQRSAREKLDRIKATYEKDKPAYEAEVTDLTRRSAQIQLERHLDSVLIRNARLKNITNDRISSLSSFGIETAFDVDKLITVKVPGIGPVLTERLIQWRESIIHSFNPQPGLPAAERAAIDQRHLPKLRLLESLLTEGPAQLKKIAEEHHTRRAALLGQIRPLVDQSTQSSADVSIMASMIRTVGTSSAGVAP